MAYTTLTNVKQYLVLENDKEDAVLNLLITQVSAAMDAIMSRTIASANYTETYDGSGEGYAATCLYLDQQPVTSVTSVVVDGTTIPASNGTSSGWLLSQGVLSLIGYSFTAGTKNITVSYTAGYATTPPALETVATMLVAQRFRERGRIGIQNESDGRGMTRGYDSEMPPWCTKILNQYASTVPHA